MTNHEALIINELPSSIHLNDNPVYLSLVLPTYNENNNIIEIIKKLSLQLDEVIPNKYELIVVDDNSPDGTADIVQSLVSSYPALKIIRRLNERGLATAVIRGWQAAQGDILGVIDADLQHPVEVLPKLLEVIKSADLVVASRNIQGGGVSDWSLGRRIVSRFAQLLGLMILPNVVGSVSDPMSGYFLVRRKMISGKVLNPLGYKILIEVLARGAKGKISEVAFVFKEREKGSSKVSIKVYIEYLVHLFNLRFNYKE